MKTFEAIIAGFIIGNVAVIAMMKGEIENLELFKVNFIAFLCIVAALIASLLIGE